MVSHNENGVPDGVKSEMWESSLSPDSPPFFLPGM